MTTDSSSMTNYTDAIANLPEGAFLGSLLWFSISQADVELEMARDALTKAGLKTDTLRKILRPVDAFKKASRDTGRKFKPDAGIRSELLVRPGGDDSGDQAHRHLIMERATSEHGRKRRIAFDQVGSLTLNRGEKVKGEYRDYSVETRRVTQNISHPLTDEEEAWLTDRLADFDKRFDHLIHFMDSHAVRTFVRDYIDKLSGTCVKESGGLYFVKQEHVAELAGLGKWIQSIGSEFHSLPLLNLADQRQMILEAFEDETIKEVERLMSDLKKILEDPERQIEERTFDAYGLRAAELKERVKEYNEMLGSRASRASTQIQIYSKQVMNLSSRVKAPKTTTPATRRRG